MFKVVKRFAVLLIAAVMAATFFPQLPEGMSVTAYAAEEKWDDFYNYNKSSTVTVDTDTYYGSSGYSIKIINSDFNRAYTKKTITVKQNTFYRFTAMAKVEGYQRDPKANKDYGATLSIDDKQFSNGYIGSEWALQTLEFNSGDRTSVTLCLSNGAPTRNCKGTV